MSQQKLKKTPFNKIEGGMLQPLIRQQTIIIIWQAKA